MNLLTGASLLALAKSIYYFLNKVVPRFPLVFALIILVSNESDRKLIHFSSSDIDFYGINDCLAVF